MGQSKSKISSSKDPEPQTFLEKCILNQFILSVVWSTHIKFPFDALVVPVYPADTEIKLMNHWMLRGLDMNVTEDLLDKGMMHRSMRDSEIKRKEYQHGKEGSISILYVKYPKYTGDVDDIDRLRKVFRLLLLQAKSHDLHQVAIPVSQANVLFTYPKNIFCNALVNVTLEVMKEWREHKVGGEDFRMKVMFIASDNSGCRLMCKQLVQVCEEEEFDQDDGITQVSSIDIVQSEIDLLAKKKLKRINNFNESMFRDSEVGVVARDPTPADESLGRDKPGNEDLSVESEANKETTVNR